MYTKKDRRSDFGFEPHPSFIKNRITNAKKPIFINLRLGCESCHRAGKLHIGFSYDGKKVEKIDFEKNMYFEEKEDYDEGFSSIYFLDKCLDCKKYKGAQGPLGKELNLQGKMKRIMRLTSEAMTKFADHSETLLIRHFCLLYTVDESLFKICSSV
jgi:hypothetical protein